MSNTKKNKTEGAQTPSVNKTKTSSEEQLWWDALYMYVKNNVLELDPKLHLNRYTVLRLRGMAQGCFVGRDINEQDLTYGYKVVLLAFDKMCPLIKYGFQNKKFHDMKHKINWMFAVVEPHLNEVYEDDVAGAKRLDRFLTQSEGVIEDIQRYQEANNYINSEVEFKTAKDWDKKHENMW